MEQFSNKIKIALTKKHNEKAFNQSILHINNWNNFDNYRI